MCATTTAEVASYLQSIKARARAKKTERMKESGKKRSAKAEVDPAAGWASRIDLPLQ